jgi:hypothetical protein
MRNKLYLGLALCLSIAACGERDVEVDDDTQTSADFAYAESSFSQVIPAVNNIGIDEEGVDKQGVLGTCATVTVSTLSGIFPRVMTVDYGAGCTDEDGRTRSGQLIITYGSAWLSDSSNVSVEMIDYHINGVLHEGQISLLKKSNSSGDMEVVSNISGGKIHTANGIIQYESIKTTEWLAGATTVDTSDDILKTYGNANGVNREGVSYASVIVQPLYQELSCDYISAGVVDLSPAGKETRSTYFGDQTCDDKATVTIGNLSFEITLQ